jgi:hypothetical protein
METMWKKIFAGWEAALFWSIIGVGLTVLITGIFDLSNRESHRETQRLLNLTLHAIESAGLGIKYSYDKNGRPTGVIITGSMNAVLPPITGSMTGTVSPPPNVNPKPEKPKE